MNISVFRNLFSNKIGIKGLQNTALLACKARSIFTSPKSQSRSFTSKAAVVIGGLGVGGGVYGYLAAPDRKGRHIVSPQLTEIDDSTSDLNIPDIRPSREVLGPAESLKLDLTLYQYHSCPFCCKVRTFLDYYGVSYKIIEVNSIMRQQIKFSKYKKVPILIVQEKTKDVKHQLNDSSVIISILGTMFLDVRNNLESVMHYYNPLSYKDEDGKDVQDVLNRYFLMYGEVTPKHKTDKDLQKERHWRKWADEEFVHLLSPNIYRTFDEALQAFHHFSDAGEWEKNFSALERICLIYVGATVMYIIGKRLKKKHSLKDDVRTSLYDGCRMWVKEVGNKKFLGGNMPNLADLAVFGILSSIEGCIAFQDLLNNTNIGRWYYDVKEAVCSHEGYALLKDVYSSSPSKC